MSSQSSGIEINRVFGIQQDFQWQQKKSTLTERVACLQKLKSVLKAREEEVKAALYVDLHKPEADAEADLGMCYIDIDDAILNLCHWMQTVEITPSPQFLGSRAMITYEARGMVLLFGPWNFPFNLIFQPLVPIIAAGNCCIVKPNEMASETSKITAKIIREVFSERHVTVFEGTVELSNQLLELPFNHIFFTGSPAVGKIVMAAAAKHLASVTLELGGKNPVVIDRNSNLIDAAGKIAAMRNINNGQICLCPENIWVPSDKKEEFLAIAKATYEAVYYIDGKANGGATGRIIDERNFKRVTSYLDDAIEKGASLYCGGGFDSETRMVHPAILTDIPSNARILEEETFGPILSVFTYDDISEVYASLHAQAKPLALYIFSRSQEFIDDVLANTSSGGVSVNTCLMHCLEHKLPFGGVNASGIGRYHGVHGFRELSHERSVLITEADTVQR